MVREISVIRFCYGKKRLRGVLRCDPGWREGGLGVCACVEYGEGMGCFVMSLREKDGVLLLGRMER